MVDKPIGADVDKLYEDIEKEIKKADELTTGVIEDVLNRVRLSQNNDLSLLLQLEEYVETQGTK